MRLNIVLIFIILIIPLSAIGQQDAIDSLKAELATNPDDTILVNIFNSLSNLTFSSSTEEAMEYAIQAKELAEKLNDSTALAYALKNIGLCHYIYGNYIEVSINWKQSFAIFQLLNDDRGSANLLSNLGVMYSDQGDDVMAIDSYLKSLRLSEKLGDSLLIASALSNVGYLYAAKEATRNKALPYFLKALTIGEIVGDQDIVGTSSFNIADAFYIKEKYDSSLLYLNKSLAAFSNTADASLPFNLMGKVYADLKDFESAVDFHVKAIEISTNFDAKYDLSECLLGLANTYQKMGASKKAISAYKKAQIHANEVGADYILKDIYEGIANSYANISDFKNAFHFQKLFEVVKDTIFNIETDDKIKNLQFTFQLDKKDLEIESLEQQAEIEQLNTKRQKLVRNISLAGFGVILVFAFLLYLRYKHKAETNRILDKQNAEIESLLLNILPEETAKELQKDGYATPRYYDQASVLFTDFKGFTKIAEGLKPHELIAELNSFFNAFDDIVEKFKLEKIKTIGDAYMCAGGIPVANDTHPLRIVKAGIAMQEYMKAKNAQRIKQGMQIWELRVGIHTGPIVAGVVGKKKYAYDIWGDTVNIASRMESNGEVGKVNISESTYELIKDHFECTHRGKIEAKNKGLIDMYFVGDQKGVVQSTEVYSGDSGSKII